jgi:hypothetical protein
MFFKQIISIALSLILFLAQSLPVYAVNTFGLNIPEINIQTKIDDAGKLIDQTKDQISKAATNIQLSSANIPKFSDFLEGVKNIELPDITISQADVVDLYSSLISALSNASKATQQVYQKSADTFDRIDLYSLVIGGAATYDTINKSLQKIPQDFSQLLREMRKVADRMKTAGMRGGKNRSDEQAFELYRKIPRTTLLENSERQVRIWLARRDGSHIRSNASGGIAEPDNIFWENSKVNRARGSADVKQYEIIRSTIRNGFESVFQNGGNILKLGAKATVTAVLIDELVENTIHAIELVREEITIDQFVGYIQDSAIKTAISTAALFTITLLATSFFPPISVPLFFSSPLILTASQIFLGTRLAVPLIYKLANS